MTAASPPNAGARNIHAGLPIDDDDASIARMLEDVSVPTLVLSLVHMTGSADWIRGELRPNGLFLNEVQGFLDAETQARVRADALEAIKLWRDGGCTLPPPPTPELIHEMMNWLVCTDVPSEYVPMMIEEMELGGVDERVVDMSDIDPARRAAFPVVVIGAGQSGVLAGVRLKQAGIPFTIIEKNAKVGGTWYENQYPGCRVDVGNHFYCYSFEPADHWSEFFCRQPELQSYFEHVAEHHGLTSDTRFETEVERLEWHDDRGVWSVSIRNPDGSREILEARAVISAVGQLNQPNLPDIPGRDDFAGPSFHSARWDHTVEHRGKRVAVIGAGASGFQIVPTIAPDVAELKVYQRTPQWMFPNPNYHEKTGEGVQWAIRHLPFYGRWYRFLIFWPGCDVGLEAARIDPDWDDGGRTVSAMNEATRQIFTDWIVSQCDGDEELIEKVVPTYPPTGKRTLQDNGSWLQALTRPNVELVTCGIDHIEKEAVVAHDGTRFECDLIVYATGFRARDFLVPIEVKGEDGIDLREHWGEEPAAYMGVLAPKFPNLFFLYGPGTNLAHGGSLIFHSECQMRFISGCIKAMLERDAKKIEPTAEAHAEYYERSQKALEGLVWSHPSIEHSWYKNSKGKIHVLSPWRLVDYWDWTREPDLEAFEIS